MKISLAISTKNDELNIVRTLKSCLNIISAVYLCDTHSTDNTVDVARTFCEANNIEFYLMKIKFESLQITNNKLCSWIESSLTPLEDWYIMISCDEYLEPGTNLDSLIEVLSNSNDEVKVANIHAHYNDTERRNTINYTKIFFIRAGCNVRMSGHQLQYFEIIDPLLNEKRNFTNQEQITIDADICRLVFSTK